jgi:uncharacterized protein (UPF0333 family)
MDFFRHPMVAALLAAIITALYLYIKDKLNNEENKNSSFFKPAALNAVLVYGIVYLGQMGRVSPVTPY